MADDREQALIAELKRRGRTDLLKQVGKGAAAVEEPPAVAESGPSIPVQAAASLSTVPQGVVDFAKNAAAPTAGNVGMGAFATATSPYIAGLSGPYAPITVPLYIAGMETLGGMGGLKFNEKALGAEPTTFDYAMQALPFVTRGAMAAKDIASKFGTPGRAASTLNALAPDEAAAQLAKIPKPAPTSAQLYEQLRGTQVNINVTPWKEEAKKLLAKEATLAGKDTGVVTYLTRLTNKLEKAGVWGLNASEFNDELIRLGRLAGKPGPAQGVYKDLFKFASDSMDDAIKAAASSAPNSPVVQQGAATLLAARQAFKRETVFKELDDAVDSAFKLVAKGGAERQFNAKEVIRAIEKNKFFEQAFSPQEQEAVKNLFYTLNEIPALKPGAGVNAGSLRAFTKTLFPMAAGGAMGMQMGGPVGASIGTAAGAIIPPALEVAGLLKLAYRTETGRALLSDLLAQSQGKLTTQVLSKLSTALAAQFAPAPQSVVPSMTGMLPMNQSGLETPPEVVP